MYGRLASTDEDDPYSNEASQPGLASSRGTITPADHSQVPAAKTAAATSVGAVIRRRSRGASLLAAGSSRAQFAADRPTLSKREVQRRLGEAAREYLAAIRLLGVTVD